ncbi:hypothetical protein [Glaesserella parasuis]|uniref:hypothetical protein n=1 Tax=Glaesserella parasuis TaxID=738 RepID=UPI001365411F|nr:hypothetical protein [Glaesserella parasuis]MWQ04723.1 hypothetical protein [Glaesserella parasuis]
METQNIVTNEQVFEKLCAIEELLLTPQIEKGLWSIKDVANYMDLSYRHVYENIVTDPRFPAPVDIPGKDGAKPKKLYIKTEVISYFERHKQKKNRI